MQQVQRFSKDFHHQHQQKTITNPRPETNHPCCFAVAAVVAASTAVCVPVGVEGAGRTWVSAPHSSPHPSSSRRSTSTATSPNRPSVPSAASEWGSCSRSAAWSRSEKKQMKRGDDSCVPCTLLTAPSTPYQLGILASVRNEILG